MSIWPSLLIQSNYLNMVASPNNLTCTSWWVSSWCTEMPGRKWSGRRNSCMWQQWIHHHTLSDALACLFQSDLVRHLSLYKRTVCNILHPVNLNKTWVTFPLQSSINFFKMHSFIGIRVWLLEPSPKQWIVHKLSNHVQVSQLAIEFVQMFTFSLRHSLNTDFIFWLTLIVVRKKSFLECTEEDY